MMVVDSQSEDYDTLCAMCSHREQQFRLLRLANQALPLSRDPAVGLWLINVSLPDMSGFDLADMLKQESSRAPVIMVADEYCEADELRTLSLGLAAYMCKPLELAGLRRCCRRLTAAHAKAQLSVHFSSRVVPAHKPKRGIRWNG
jgi:DNA-binding response OmpR family regulator